jgi:DNA replication protein DnaC
MTPDTDPASTQSIIERTFLGMMSACDQRTARFRRELETICPTGPCPACTAQGQPLDESESLELSVQRNRLMPVYVVCGHCMAEAQRQEMLARYGVPRRVRHATFENFIVTDPKQQTALDAVAWWLRERESLFLFLIGSCGAGKGHLAAAAVRRSAVSATWTTHADLIDGYHGLPMERRPGYIGRLQRVPLLILDEIGGKNATSDTAEIFYKILDRRYDEGLKTILIGNIPYRQGTDTTKPSIISLCGDDRIESRFAQTGKVVPCKWKDYRLPTAPALPAAHPPLRAI